MRALSDADVLSAWERARVAGQSAIGPLFLLAAAYPDEPFESLARLSIGQRDRLLLELRESLFGSNLNGLTDCAACEQTLEVHLDASALKLSGEQGATDPLSIAADGYEIVLRLPDSVDLSAISGAASVPSGRTRLLERLVISCLYQGQPTEAKMLPEAIVELVEERMSAAEPQADIQLNLVCAHCEARNETLFDIGSFLCKEVEVLALRLLREIHELARAYSWSETEVLAMSSWRRRCYMEMLGA
jgi:hypothetical protein